jgi:UDP-N-acetylglucosamine 4-epimerase
MNYLELENFLNNKRHHWLVTGGAGFIGSSLAERLIKLGQQVSVLDNLSTGSAANIEYLEQKASEYSGSAFKFIKGDIADLNICKTSMAGIDFVLHQAALGSVPRSISDPVATHNSNLTGFLNILIAAQEQAISGFVYASSSSVYGDSQISPKKESDCGAVLSPYAASKKGNELYAESFAPRTPFKIIGLRYFNVFGPRQDPQGPYAAVIPRWIQALKSGIQPVIFGDGETSRDFCFIENVVQVNLLAAFSSAGLLNNQDLLTTDIKSKKASVYNVAAGRETTLNQLYQLILSSYCEASRMSIVECPEARYEGFRDGDIRRSLADLTTVGQELNYEPAVSVSEGIGHTVRWFLTS